MRCHQSPIPNLLADELLNDSLLVEILPQNCIPLQPRYLFQLLAAIYYLCKKRVDGNLIAIYSASYYDFRRMFKRSVNAK